jgi:transposase
MEHFAGLDISVKETSVCIVDDTGRIVREVKAASEPEALLSSWGTPRGEFVCPLGPIVRLTIRPR